PPTAIEIAQRVDAALVRGLAANVRLPALTDDATFLRRVTLDLTGKLPDTDTMRRFVADPSSDKRSRLVEELLKSETYTINWGRYWRDALTYHTPASNN